MGLIIDKRTNNRVRLPVLSETVINSENNEFAFRSNMSIEQHAKFNRFLNGYVNEKSKITYVHLKEIDHFITVRKLEFLGQIRKTIDEKSEKCTAIIIKKRIGDLEIFMPSKKFDCSSQQIAGVKAWMQK